MPSKRAKRESAPWKPTREQLLAAEGKRIADLIAPGLRVLFCGINPGLYSGAVGHHFARPGNRFWPALHAGGFTEQTLSPFEEHRLLDLRLGITNVIDRATASAAELRPEEYLAGGARLRRKVLKYRPQVLAVLGVGAYRTAFDRPDAAIGPQEAWVGATRLWVLPNPSGLNAHYQPAALGKLFAELRRATE